MQVVDKVWTPPGGRTLSARYKTFGFTQMALPPNRFTIYRTNLHDIGYENYETSWRMLSIRKESRCEAKTCSFAFRDISHLACSSERSHLTCAPNSSSDSKQSKCSPSTKSSVACSSVLRTIIGPPPMPVISIVRMLWAEPLW